MADGFLQVLGLIRWSYPSDVAAFKAEAATMDELRARLYAPLRMEERLFYLEHVVLPCIREQTDPNFKMVLLLGENLPDPWRGQVLDLVSGISQIVPVFEEEGQKHAALCRKVMRAHRNMRAAAVAEFRLDDDDAMARDFVAETRKAYRQHRALLAAHGAFCLDHTKGFAMVTRGTEVSVRPVFAHLWGISQALFYPPEHRKSLLDYPHKWLWTSMPNITVPGAPKWVRGVHQTNDSGIADGVDKLRGWDCPEEQVPMLLATEFAIDLTGVREGWAKLKSRHAA